MLYKLDFFLLMQDPSHSSYLVTKQTAFAKLEIATISFFTSSHARARARVCVCVCVCVCVSLSLSQNAKFLPLSSLLLVQLIHNQFALNY